MRRPSHRKQNTKNALPVQRHGREALADDPPQIVAREEPLFETAAGHAHRALQTAESKGLVNQVGYHFRFVGAFQEAARLVKGGAIGTVAVIIKQELLLIFIGGVFVAEGLSVIIQVASFKLRGKRVFRMAPFHHHFELSGWSESKVIIRFWIAAIILSLLALSTLKLR